MAAAGAAVVKFGADSLQVSSNFDKSMSQVAATMGYTVAELNTEGSEAAETFKTLSNFAQEMGRTTAFSASQSADALNFMALAGYDATTSMKMLPNVLNLAAAGNIELADASDMVTDAQSALGLSLTQTSTLVDKMAKASSKSNTSVAQLGSAMLTVGGTAKVLSGGTTELSAALGILADNNIKGAEGGTALRNVILALSGTTPKARKNLAELGVEAFDANGNMRPLNETFADLNAALSTMSDEQRTQALSGIFNKVDLKSVNALLATSTGRWEELTNAIDNAWFTTDSISDALSDVGLDLSTMQKNLNALGISTEDFNDILAYSERSAEDFAFILREAAAAGVSEQDIINALGGDLEVLQTAFDNTAGAAQHMADTQLDNLAGDVTMFQSALEGAQYIVGKSLDPAMRQFVQFATQGISDITNAFENGGLDAAMEQFGTTLSTGLSMVISMLPKVIDAAGQIVVALVQGIVSNLPQVATSAGEIILTLTQGLLSALPNLIPAGVEMVKQLALANIQNTSLMIEAAGQLIVGLGQGLLAALPDLISAVPQIISELISSLLSSIPLIIDTGIQLLTALISDLPTIIETVISAIPEIISGLVLAILSNIPQIIDAGVRLLTSLVDNLPTIISTVVLVIPQVVSSLASTFIKNAPQIAKAGFDLFVSLIKNAPQIIVQLLSIVPQILRSLVSALGQGVSQFAQVGQNLVLGIRQGIANGWKALTSFVAEKAQSLLATAKSVLGIASPSKLFASQVGEMIPAGIDVGIDAAMPDTIRNIQNQLDMIDRLNMPSIGVGINSNANMTAASSGAYDGYGGRSEIVLMIDGHELARFLAPSMSSQLAFGRA